MNVKIDTKEKYTVITPNETHLSAIMTAEIKNLLLAYIQKDIPHIILNLKTVSVIDKSIAQLFAETQQAFYAQHCSFVICNLQESLKKIFKKDDLIDLMNITPTESEAWDIVQMEEIEREILGNDKL